MSKSNDECPLRYDIEEIQKKGEFEAFKRKLELEREKTLHQLWHEAEESVKKLWERGRNEGESFWKYALVHESVPISYPRDPSEREKLIKKLQDKGQFHPRLGRRRESGSILQLEVETILQRITTRIY